MIPKLRILQIVPSLVDETGGPSRSIPSLARALTAMGHQVVTYTTDWPSGALRAVRSQHGDGYEVVTFPSESSPLYPDLPHSPALIRTVESSWPRFDVIHSFSLWNPVASFSLRTLRKAGASYCLSPLGMLDPIVLGRHRWRKLPWWWLLERENIAGASLVHFTAPLEEKKALSCGVRLRRTVVVPHVVDLGYWADLPARSLFEERFPQTRGREVILFVGRIDWVKNLRELLHALVMVRQGRPSAMLVCAGPDNSGHGLVLQKMATELGIDEHVLFTGMLRGMDLKAAYARADTFALVSQKENFGQAAAEALSCGVPLVLSEGVGLAGDSTANGPIVKVKPEPQLIADALVRMLRRSASTGIPDPEARALAMRQFSVGSASMLSSAYLTIQSLS